MPNPSAAEAAAHLERAIAEAQRLGQFFAQRNRDEKKRMSLLQQLVPRLKRLAKSQSIEKALTKDELDALEALKPPAKG